MKEQKECVIPNCANKINKYSNKDICSSCYKYYLTGKRNDSQAYKNEHAGYLAMEEFNEAIFNAFKPLLNIIKKILLKL